MGQSTINGVFSAAMLVYQRVRMLYGEGAEVVFGVYADVCRRCCVFHKKETTFPIFEGQAFKAQ